MKDKSKVGIFSSTHITKQQYESVLPLFSEEEFIAQSSLSYNNKSLDGDIIFVGDCIDLNKTSDAVVDLTEESSVKMNLITQSSNDDDAKRNLVDSEGKVAGTLLPYKLLPFNLAKAAGSFV